MYGVWIYGVFDHRHVPAVCLPTYPHRHCCKEFISSRLIPVRALCSRPLPDASLPAESYLDKSPLYANISAGRQGGVREWVGGSSLLIP